MESKHHQLSDSGRNLLIPRGQVIDVLKNLNVKLLLIITRSFR